MSNKVLTIVVPSYNVERFLDECIQPYVTPVCDERLEVIIVNDGSTDATELLAEKHATAYPNVVRVINKVNGGHGSTINAGLEAATGKYFKVIDGDDYVDNRELIRFLDLLERSNEDVITNDKVNFLDGNKPDNNCRLVFGPVAYDEHITMENITADWNYTMHRITIRTDLLRGKMPPIDEHCFYVDQELIVYSLALVQTLRASDTIMYYYRLGNANQSVAPANAFKRRGNLLTVIHSILKFYKNEKSNITYEAVTDYIEQIIAEQINRYATICLSNVNSSADDVLGVLDLEKMVKTEMPSIYKKIPKNKYYSLAKIMPRKIYLAALHSYLRGKAQ